MNTKIYKHPEVERFMNNDKATINGLMDGISVLENNNTNEQPYDSSDRIYNDEEPISFGIEINDKLD